MMCRFFVWLGVGAVSFFWIVVTGVVAYIIADLLLEITNAK